MSVNRWNLVFKQLYLIDILYIALRYINYTIVTINNL